MAKRIRDLTTGTPAAGDFLVVDPASGSTYKVPLIGSGGVIEYGSNSNGHYVRFADGTQFCWASHANDSYDPLITGEDPNYLFRTKIWVFPATFISPPVVTHSGDVAGAMVDVLTAYDISNTQCTLEAGQYNTSSIVVKGSHTLAIGRWK